MIKKKRYGDTTKEQLRAAARDRLCNFLLADGMVRGVILNGTRMVNEMRANFGFGILETLVLGHAYLAAGLLSANLKGNDRLSLQVECSGPIKGLVVESNAFGEVRGYLKNVPIPIHKPLENFDLAPFYGAGFLSLTKHLESAKQPFQGRIMMENGSIAKDLAVYHLQSEQVPTAFNLSVKFDPEGVVIGAGGLFLQAMPGADEETIARLESLVVKVTSLGEVFAAHPKIEAFLEQEFAAFAPRLLAQRRVEFMCHCSQDRIHGLLGLLPPEEMQSLCSVGPFPVEMRCHHCNTPYAFSQKELQAVYARRFPDSPGAVQPH